jgi:hypothetical protein
MISGSPSAVNNGNAWRPSGLAQGWLGQYWSLSPKDTESSDDIVSKLLREQFEVLQSLNPNR